MCMLFVSSFTTGFEQSGPIYKWKREGLQKATPGPAATEKQHCRKWCFVGLFYFALVFIVSVFGRS